MTISLFGFFLQTGNFLIFWGDAVHFKLTYFICLFSLFKSTPLTFFQKQNKFLPQLTSNSFSIDVLLQSTRYTVFS